MSRMRLVLRRGTLAAAACVMAMYAMLAAGAGATGVAMAAASAGPTGPSWANTVTGGQVTSEVISPDGKTVYVTGATVTYLSSAATYQTVAYNAATGAQIWLATYTGPKGEDQAASIAVSRDGTSVYVTGQSAGPGSDPENFATVAYDAATGTQRWAARYSGGGGASASAASVAVSPDGASVYVTGDTGTSAADSGVTISYNAATGALQWLSHKGINMVRVAVGPGGGTVYAVGQDTIAFDAATGAVRWSHDFSYPELDRLLATSPDGKTVYVSGETAGNYSTVAYSAATGKELWGAGYNDPNNQTDTPHSLAVGPGGHIVYVTGSALLTFTAASVPPTEYATIAYSAATGAQEWITLYNPVAGNDLPSAMVTTPDGTGLVIAGTGQIFSSPFDTDFETFAYKV